MEDDLTETKGSILAIDDEPGIRKFMDMALSRKGYAIRTAANTDDGEAKLKEESADVVILDIRMPGRTGEEFLPELVAAHPHTSVIMLTAVGDTETAVNCMRQGAFDYLLKPFELQVLIASIDRALEHTHLLQERARLEKLQEDLTHMIIHDMRNELSPILAVLELVSMNKSLGEKDQKFVKGGMEAIMRLSNMTTSLLEVAKLEKGEMELKKEALDPKEIIQEAVKTFSSQAERRNIQVQVKIETEEKVTGDRELLRRVLVNLLHNAFKFTPREGSIIVFVEQKDSSLLFGVRDSGPGVPKDFREKIFEKFSSVELRSQGERRGVGLGLTFCKLVVEAHSGKIWVESEENAGSTFLFTLPLTNPH